MKKLFGIVLLLCLFAAPAYAQFPATITVMWDVNPATENVTSYTVKLDANAGVAVDPGTHCNATTCSQTMTVTATGQHTLTLTASNMWDVSLPATLTFTASTPGKSQNLKFSRP